MPKTPDETKKGLECCAASYADCHKECPYKLDCDGSQILKDALALIQQLQAENAEKDVRIRVLEDHLREATKKVEQLEAERDAAVSDIARGSRCSVCKKFFKNGGECSGGVYCIPLNFEWRGVQKEE